MKSKLPDMIVSAGDLVSVINELKTYRRWFEQAATKQKVSGSQASLPPAPMLSAEAASILQPGTSYAKLDELIDWLQKALLAAPQITVTLAAPAAGELRRQLTAWCRQEIAGDVLVSFGFNRLLLGGMIVRCGSHIYDWSFRRQLLDKRAAFPEVLQRVL